MKTWLATSLLGLVLVVGLAACSPGMNAADAAPERGVTEVAVKDMQFQPPAIEVVEGTTVTWSFEDGSMQHDVKGDGWGSEIQTSGTYQHTFDEPGEHAYHCSLHPNMTGRVVVTPN